MPVDERPPAHHNVDGRIGGEMTSDGSLDVLVVEAPGCSWEVAVDEPAVPLRMARHVAASPDLKEDVRRLLESGRRVVVLTAGEMAERYDSELWCPRLPLGAFSRRALYELFRCELPEYSEAKFQFGLQHRLFNAPVEALIGPALANMWNGLQLLGQDWGQAYHLIHSGNSLCREFGMTAAGALMEACERAQAAKDVHAAREAGLACRRCVAETFRRQARRAGRS